MIGAGRSGVGKGACAPFLCVWDRARYTKLELAEGPDEAAVQHHVLVTLARLGIRAWETDAGAKKARAILARTLFALKISKGVISRILAAVTGFLPEGHPDITGYTRDGRAVFIEVKAPEKVDPTTGRQLRAAGKPSPEQIAFLTRAHAAGCVVGIAWSAGDALSIVEAADRAA